MVEQTYAITKVETVIKEKKTEIAEVAEQIVALRERMSPLNREINDLKLY